MIVDALIAFAHGLVSLMLAPLPAGASHDYAAVGAVVAEASKWNALLPIGELVAVVSLVVGIEVLKFGIWLFDWVYKHIPVIGH